MPREQMRKSREQIQSPGVETGVGDTGRSDKGGRHPWEERALTLKSDIKWQRCVTSETGAGNSSSVCQSKNQILASSSAGCAGSNDI